MPKYHEQQKTNSERAQRAKTWVSLSLLRERAILLGSTKRKARAPATTASELPATASASTHHKLFRLAGQKPETSTVSDYPKHVHLAEEKALKKKQISAA